MHRATLSSVLLFLTFILVNFSAATPLTPRQTSANLRLDVFRRRYPIDPNSVGFSGRLDIEPNGSAVFNRTATPGLYYYALNGPDVGPATLFQRGTGKLAYLEPLSGMTGHYQLKFAKTIPTGSGILSQKWTRQARECGGMCGGIDLRYNELPSDQMPSGATFYLLPHTAIPGAWHIRYTNGVGSLPANAYSIILWAPFA